jgi:lipopolysaccharide transport system ATP-binding protein
MSDLPLISVDRLSKRYVIGHEAKHDTLMDTMGQGLRGMWAALARRRARTAEDFWALRDVSFSVGRGEVVGVVGRNGAGKSTLLKLLSRITEPTSGRIALSGRVASLLEVGTGFHPELSGRDNIFLNGAILGMSRVEIRRRFDEIVAFAEVERFLDTPVKRYSSGMYVRLAFAVAAHLEPDILIVDEVLAVGDAQFQQKCLGKMQSVAEQGQTILFVSHNLKAVEHFCKKCLLLENGQLVLNDTSHKVVGEYLRRGAARLENTELRALNDELDLVALALAPVSVVVRGPLEVILTLQVKLECLIQDLHLFIYNSFGERAAILDLRDFNSGDGTRALCTGARITFSTKVERVVLVEGLYRLGITLRTARHFNTVFDLIDLQVTAPASQTGPMPYAAEYQGTTLLDYKCSATIVPSPA